MYVLRLGDYRVIVGLVLAILIVLGVLLFRLVLIEDYTTMTVTEIPWGTGEHQLGQGTGLDGQLYGPRSFAVDQQGYVYVADTFNHRIVILDPSGAWLTDFGFGGSGDTVNGGSAGFIQDIAVDADRNIYAVDYGGTGVYRYDHVGNLLQQWPLNDEAALAVTAGSASELWVANRLDAVEPGRVVVARTRISSDEYLRQVNQVDLDENEVWSLASVTLTASSQAPWEDEAQPGLFHTFASTPGGLLVTEEPSGPFTRLVKAWEKDQLNWETTIDSTKFIVDAALVGADRRNRVYLALTVDGAEGEVYRLDAQGARRILQVPAEADILAHVAVRVAGDGSVYTMRPSAQGVVFEKEEYRRHWTMVPRSVLARR